MTRRDGKKSRLQNYDIGADPSDHELIGVLPSAADWPLASASLKRRENITLILSDSTDANQLHLRLRWRPMASLMEGAPDSNIVALDASISLRIEGRSYELEQQLAYRATESNIRLGHITQYGDSSSKVKLIIHRPYMRMRLIISGNMRHKEEPEKSSFVKFSAVFCGLSGSFDFLNEFDSNYIKSYQKDKKLARDEASIQDELLLFDCHEQLVRAHADCLIIDEANQRSKSSLLLWGFHQRHFVQDKMAKRTSDHLYLYLANGQVCHLVRTKVLGGEHESDQLEYGYTCLTIDNLLEPMMQPFELDWSKVVAGGEAFELSVGSPKISVSGKVTRRAQDPTGCFYDADVNGKRGWAFVSTAETSDHDNDVLVDSLRKLCQLYESNQRDGSCVPDVDSLASLRQSATEKTPLVVSLLDPVCLDHELVGSKAASLSQLQAFSSGGKSEVEFSVPFGLVLTRHAYQLILDTNKELAVELEQLERLVGEISAKSEKPDTSRLQEECLRLQQKFEALEAPSELRDQIKSKLEAHYTSSDMLEGTKFAVRSSSWGEDEEFMSAAGQLSTILGVEGKLDQIAGAAMKCFASKLTFANVEYKRQHGLGPNLPMAVVVQEMVACDKAGVVFTCDPSSGHPNRLTITANYGLGESVVSGKSEPDQVVVVRCPRSKQLSVAEVIVGRKELVIDAQSLATGQSGDQYDKSRCCLSDEESLKLARCSWAVADYFQSASRDIEWGFQGERLHLLQSRPVTSLELFSDMELLHELDLPSRMEHEYCTRANVGVISMVQHDGATPKIS